MLGDDLVDAVKMVLKLGVASVLTLAYLAMIGVAVIAVLTGIVAVVRMLT